MIFSLISFLGPENCQAQRNICSQVNDFIGSRRASIKGTLVRLEDFLFASLAFPIGMFVGLAFWGLYAVDRELVYPTALDKIVPHWVNHALHTTWVGNL